MCWRNNNCECYEYGRSLCAHKYIVCYDDCYCCVKTRRRRIPCDNTPPCRDKIIFFDNIYFCCCN